MELVTEPVHAQTESGDLLLQKGEILIVNFVVFVLNLLREFLIDRDYELFRHSGHEQFLTFLDFPESLLLHLRQLMSNNRELALVAGYLLHEQALTVLLVLLELFLEPLEFLMQIFLEMGVVDFKGELGLEVGEFAVLFEDVSGNEVDEPEVVREFEVKLFRSRWEGLIDIAGTIVEIGEDIGWNAHAGVEHVVEVPVVVLLGDEGIFY